MPSAVIEAMSTYRAQLDAQERAAGTRMAAAWLDATRGLDGDMERLALELSNAAAAGRPVRRWHVYRMERYQQLMRQLGGQLREYAPVAVAEMEAQQTLLARWGIEHAEQLVNMQTEGITGQFNRLPVAAVQNMVGNAGDGTPLGQLLRASWGQQAPDVAGALTRGVALGWHPSKIAQAMRQAANVPLERALVIARTEGLRVYREASRQSYQRSGLVSGYLRIAAKSTRTCVACLFSDGQFYPLDVPFEEHVQGRCQAIPRVKGAAPIEFEKGPAWFARQDAATQRAMLGAGRYDAWQAGQFALSDVVARVENDAWGASLQVRSLAELLSGDARAAVTVTPAPVVAPSINLPYRPSQAHLDIVAGKIDNEVLGPLAAQYGESIPAIENRLMTEMERYVSGQVPRVRVGENAAISILRDGRYKTEFEIEAAGSFVKTARVAAENAGLGAPTNLAPNLRPVYGYYDTPQHGARAYGQVEFVLKPAVVPRTTVTLGDSLYPMQGDLMAGVPANAPTKHAFGNLYSANSLLRNDMAETYIEAQIHGGLGIDDVAEVILHPNSYNAADLARVEAAYRQQGIKVTYGSIDDD